MKVNSNNKRDISFKGFWNSKGVIKGLQFASENGALFAATTTLALSAGVRPLAIMATPKTSKENKKIACAKSIMSGIIEFGLTLAISMPIAIAFKKIDKNPEKYLNIETIKTLKNQSKNLKESKTYSLATQLFKLGLGFAIILPKSILTAAGIPFIMEKTSNYKQKDSKQDVIFQGKGNDKLAKGLGKFLENKSLQDFAIKYQNSNFPMHMFVAKDIFATTAFIGQANRSEKIKNEQKPFLIKNSIISTVLSVLSGYTIDKLTDKQAENIITKIKTANKNDPNLAKYIEGFKIFKPIFILATVYYTIIPILSAFFAQKCDNNTNYSSKTKPSVSAESSTNL